MTITHNEIANNISLAHTFRSSRAKHRALVDTSVRRPQPIADAGLGQDVVRPLGVGLDLLPQLAHIDAQILRVGQIVPQLASRNLWVSTLPACCTSRRSRSYSLGESFTSSSPTLTMRRTRSTERSPTWKTGRSPWTCS